MSNKTDTAIIRTEELDKHYTLASSFVDRLFGSTPINKAVDSVDLEIREGETYGLVGESGSGKTTLGETVLRLRDPTDGSIYYRGRDISNQSQRNLHEFRRNAQIVLQDPYEALNPRQTVFQIISEPVRNFRKMDREPMEDLVIEMLEDVGLRPPEEMLSAYPEQLSGGQRQRVNIARALILKPEFLVADEPLSMLDVSIQAGIIKLLNGLKEEYGFTLLYISHNLSIVKLLSDRLGIMYKGRIVEEGEADAVMENPQHPYTEALVQSLPDLRTERERVKLPEDTTDEGEEIQGCRFHPRCPKKKPECTEAPPALKEVDGRKVTCYLHHSDQLPADD
ncbi:MAG: peptide/nickel transport system ATP-binding protein [Natronomonas sp.]|jgi:peptide/nickel transport system ATP-binding protein